MSTTAPSKSRSWHRHTARVCGLACAGIGALALLGWAFGLPLLSGLRANYIPMAPNTALSFLVLGMSLFAITIGGPPGSLAEDRNDGLGTRETESASGPYRARWLAGLGTVPVLLIAILRLFEMVTSGDLGVDSWFMHVPSARLGLAPVGKMALLTSIAFVASSVPVVVLALPVWSKGSTLVGAGGLIAGTIGLIFTLGYLFSPDAPLLYGTESIPMALNTALGFVLLGSGLVAAAGQSAYPIRRMVGTSIKARLLRVFLPLVVGTVVLVAWLTHVVSMSVGASSAAISAAALATASIFIFGFFVERMAGRVGEQIEQAEAALQRAHDELEIKVEERTRNLSQTNSELIQAFEDLKTAHESLQKAHLELKLTQGRMLHQAKLASLGQTAAGVAHEINNPLAFVTNNMVVLKREVSGLHDVLRLYQQAESTLAEYQRDLHQRIRELSEEVDLPFVLSNLDDLLDRSRDGLKRIQKIVEDLRDFARLDEAEYKEADLNAGINATVNIMRGLAEKHRITLESDLTPLPCLRCFPAKLNLVLQNLIFNAIDATPPGGKIIVASRPGDGEIEIGVTDTGCGIDPAIRHKVFDPFFTTKPVGKGTGLGLAMSHGIVKDHGGTIDFESTPGQGTRFSIRLPLNPPAPPAPARDLAGMSASF